MNNTTTAIPALERDSIIEDTISQLQTANEELRNIMVKSFFLVDGDKVIANNFWELQPRMVCFAALLDALTNKLAACYNLAPESYRKELAALLAEG